MDNNINKGINKGIDNFQIEKEMGYSQLEFINQFKLFAKHLNFTSTKNIIIVSGSGQDQKKNTHLKISFNPLADRSIGALKISRLAVTFEFSNYSPQQMQQFLKQFDLSFQRGGG